MSLIKSHCSDEPKSRFTLLYGNRDSSSVIFLEALAALKDQYLDRFEIYHFLDQEEQEIELFNGMLDRARCDEAIADLVPDAGEVDGWFICGPGPMMDAAEGALLERGIAKDRIHIERFTADRPAEAVAREIAELQIKAEGVTCRSRSTGAHGACLHRRQYPRQRPRGGPFGTLRLQGGRMRDLPGESDQGQGRDGCALWPDRRGSRRRLCADLPVGADGRRSGGGLRRLVR